ncbi:hypothetical protein [uncultured Rikenella sp.]|nr:hypothetical protein [uncultured Rikenella sp.]
MYFVGAYGYSYSSAAIESNCLHLYFRMDGLFPVHVNGRSYGFPLRCLSE